MNRLGIIFCCCAGLFNCALAAWALANGWTSNAVLATGVAIYFVVQVARA